MNPEPKSLCTDIEGLSQYAFLAPAFAHDSANFLTVLEGVRCSLRESLNGGDFEEMERCLSLLEDQIQLLSEFFMSFLGREKDRRYVGVASVVLDYVDLFKAVSKECEIEFSITGVENLENVQVPKLDFSKVIVNLLKNACAACLQLDPEERRIEILGQYNSRPWLRIQNSMATEATTEKHTDCFGLKSIVRDCDCMQIGFETAIEGKRFISTLQF